MPSLKERRLVKKPCCAKCRHCFPIRTFEDDTTWMHYCLLDLSREEVDFIYQEVDKVSRGCISNLYDYSSRFVELMSDGLLDFDAFCNPRIVLKKNCCQFYEEDKDA